MGEETEKRTFEMLDIILGKQFGVAMTPCAKCRKFTPKMDNQKCKTCTVEPSEFEAK